MIDVGKLPELDFPFEVRNLGTAFSRAFATIAHRATDVQSTWQGLAGAYHAPEAGQVLAAMNTPASKGTDLAAKGLKVQAALDTYADRLEQLQQQKNTLIGDINSFYAHKAQVEADNSHNNIVQDIGDFFSDEQGDLLDQENALADRCSQLQADKDAAERDCANAIGDIWGGDHYEAADETWSGDTTTYGLSADGYQSLAKSGDVPWGAPSMWSSTSWRARIDMIDDGATDSVVSMFTSVGDLVGFGGGGKAKAAWSGLWQLGVASWHTSLIGSQFSTPEQIADSTEQLLGMGKALIGWNNWDTSGWQTGGGIGFDLALTAATFGTGAAVKGGFKGLELAGDSAEVGAATKFTRLAGLGKDAKLPLTDLSATIRTRLATGWDTTLTKLRDLQDGLGPKPALAGGDVPSTSRWLTDATHLPDRSTGPTTLHMHDNGPGSTGADSHSGSVDTHPSNEPQYGIRTHDQPVGASTIDHDLYPSGHPSQADVPSDHTWGAEHGRPGFQDQVSPAPGTSDGGPGSWQNLHRNANGAQYQEHVTGVSRGPGGTPEYVVNSPNGKVEFDGHLWREGSDGRPHEVYLEAKGDYGFVDRLAEKIPSKRDETLGKWVRQAEGQLKAMPPDARLEWHFSRQSDADLAQRLFARRNMNIHVFNTPED